MGEDVHECIRAVIACVLVKNIRPTPTTEALRHTEPYFGEKELL